MTFKPTQDAKELLPENVYASIDSLVEIIDDVAESIASQAGKVASTVKPDGTPQTNVDIEVEDKIIDSFKNLYPEVPIFGEESEYSNDLPQTCWLIDPIDGTKNFLEGIPKYTSMAVLVHNDIAVASIISHPYNGDLFLAKLGMGAYKNQEKLDLSTTPMPKLAYSRTDLMPKIMELFNTVGMTFDKTVSGGGYGFSMIASGNLVARFNIRSGGYLHDYAPGALLVSEAGGALIPILEDTYSYRTRSFVACHPGLVDLVMKNLDELRKLENPNNMAY